MSDLLVHLWALWVLIAIAAALLEVLLPAFAFSFASLGAAVAALAALWWGLEVQLAVFCLASLISLVLLRPLLLRKVHSHHHMPSRTQTLFGVEGQVTQAIDGVSSLGRVFVNGQDWSAQSEQMIDVGTVIKVVGADGITLIVEKA